MWIIKITSDNDLSDFDRDVILELVSETARKNIIPYYFILHDVVESKKYSELLIEGPKIAINDLIVIISENLPYKITSIQQTQ
ncbi:MAG: hypothetical protein WHV28_09235 [Bacteroidota bacterium]